MLLLELDPSGLMQLNGLSDSRVSNNKVVINAYEVKAFELICLNAFMCK